MRISFVGTIEDFRKIINRYCKKYPNITLKEFIIKQFNKKEVELR